MLSANAQNVWQQALLAAKSKQHRFVTTEHLLLALLNDTQVQRLITTCGGSFLEIQSQLKGYLENHKALVQKEPIDRPSATGPLDRLMGRSIDRLKFLETPQVQVSQLLMEILYDKESTASFFLSNQGITAHNVVRHISWEEAQPKTLFQGPFTSQKKKEGSHPSPLTQFTTNLTEKARLGELRPFVGRREVLNQLVHTLSRWGKCNPILIGDPGVGKTALVEGLTQWLCGPHCHHPTLAGSTVYALDLASLLGGSRYRGDFEERLKDLINEIKSHKKIILFIDEIHMIVGAGGASSTYQDAANFLKPHLTDPHFKCIGATTPYEYKASIEKDPALARRFQPFTMTQPTPQETLLILKGLLPKLEQFHNVHYSSQALVRAIELGCHHMPHRNDPDRSLDLLDEAGALRKGSRGARATQCVVGTRDVDEALTRLVPIARWGSGVGQRFQNLSPLAQALKAQVVGQDSAIDTLVAALARAQAAPITAPNRPRAVFVFTGPRGVGHTHTANCLARELGVPLVALAMETFSESHGVAKLVGSPPGYVGFMEGGQLTSALHKHPHCVVLFQGLDLAHPQVLQALAPLFQEGRLRDGSGRVAHFQNAIVLVTLPQRGPVVSMGFGSRPPEENLQTSEGSLKMVLEGSQCQWVAFSPLDLGALATLALRGLEALQKEFKKHRVALDWAPECGPWLAAQALEAGGGSPRFLKGLIDRWATAPLVETLSQPSGRSLRRCRLALGPQGMPVLDWGMQS